MFAFSKSCASCRVFKLPPVASHPSNQKTKSMEIQKITQIWSICFPSQSLWINQGRQGASASFSRSLFLTQKSDAGKVRSSTNCKFFVPVDLSKKNIKIFNIKHSLCHQTCPRKAKIWSPTCRRRTSIRVSRWASLALAALAKRGTM